MRCAVSSFTYSNALTSLQYQSIRRHLSGAIPDAEAMVDFLESHLSVPSSHIRVLKGPEATRQNIINAFQEHLIANPEIKYGDPMIFYFAGNGAQSAAPKGWQTNNGMVEYICPWDATAIEENGSDPVYCIPDRTVWALFHELAHLKGNSITAILDCCHTTGMPRVRRPLRHMCAFSDTIYADAVPPGHKAANCWGIYTRTF